MRDPRFYGLGRRLERILVRLVVLCAVVLVVFQSIAVNDPMRRVIGYVDLEDVAVSPNTSQNLVPEEPTITLYLKEYTSLPKVHVLVNGESQGQFQDRYFTFQVQEGDLIQVDATFYDHPVEVQVITASEQIIFPKKGKFFHIEGISSLGKVRLEDTR